jgi:hypothetical protein
VNSCASRSLHPPAPNYFRPPHNPWEAQSPWWDLEMYFGWKENRKCTLRGREGEDGTELIDKWSKCSCLCWGRSYRHPGGIGSTRMITTSSSVTGPVDGRARTITPLHSSRLPSSIPSLQQVLS